MQKTSCEILVQVIYEKKIKIYCKKILLYKDNKIHKDIFYSGFNLTTYSKCDYNKVVFERPIF